MGYGWWEEQERDGYAFRFLDVPGAKVGVRRLGGAMAPMMAAVDTEGRVGPGVLPGLSARTRNALLRAGYGTRTEVEALVRGDLGAGYGLFGVRNLGKKGRAELWAWLTAAEPRVTDPLPDWVGEE